MSPFPSSGLYAIADAGNGTRDLVAFSRAVLTGGASALQYRAKTTPCISTAQRIRDMCRRHNVPFIVNDDADLAAELSADGIHLGRTDDDCRHVRRRFGARMIIGVSCYNALSSAAAAVRDGADYVALGSFYPSRSKPDARRAPLERLEQTGRLINKPIVAIGGICLDNAPALLAAGAEVLAVISDLMDHTDPERQARLYNTLILENGRQR